MAPSPVYSLPPRSPLRRFYQHDTPCQNILEHEGSCGRAGCFLLVGRQSLSVCLTGALVAPNSGSEGVCSILLTCMANSYLASR